VAALDLARGGRDVVVLDRDAIGSGASTRNAGYLGRTLKHGFGDIMAAEGLARAIAVYAEMQAAFDSVAELVRDEGIDCGFVRCGRFTAAPTPAHYDALARELQEHVKRETAPYKYPRRIDFVAELPKTPSGKIQRFLLRAELPVVLGLGTVALSLIGLLTLPGYQTNYNDRNYLPDDLPAMEGFAAARRRDPHGEVANALVDVLRRSGQDARADELARTLTA